MGSETAVASSVSNTPDVDKTGMRFRCNEGDILGDLVGQDGIESLS